MSVSEYSKRQVPLAKKECVKSGEKKIPIQYGDHDDGSDDSEREKCPSSRVHGGVSVGYATYKYSIATIKITPPITARR